MNKFFCLTALLITLTCTACLKETQEFKAKIVDTGNLTNEGCGYMVELDVDGQVLKPIALPSAYQHDGLEVFLRYNTTEQFDTCSAIPNLYPFVIVNSIRRAN